MEDTKMNNPNQLIAGVDTKTMEPPADGPLALRPCPFCGSPEVVYIEYHVTVTPDPRYAVMCSNCVATIDPGWTIFRSQVAEMWNKRAAEVPQAG